MKRLMLGNDAVAQGAYEAGVKVVSSYPGTPSTEITEAIAKFDEIYSEWAPNEKVAMEVAIGASFAGARSMTCMKHVGLNVAADPLFTASYTGVNGGMVICVADDPGMHSSQNEQDSRQYARAAKVVMLEPADSQECKDFVKRAFEISEEYDTPVIIRLTTRIAHSQSMVEIGRREDVKPKAYTKDVNKYVMMPAMARRRHVVVEERIRKLEELSEQFAHQEINDTKIGVIASGICYQYAKEALDDKVSYLKLDMVYPLPSKVLSSFAAKCDKVYVIEELDPVIEEHCRAIGLDVIGKDKFTMLGEYSAGMLAKVVLADQGAEQIRIHEPVPVRPPVMCPGCPHRGVFYVLKKLGLTVNGDIGCYTLGALAPLQSLDTSVCMGASVGMAHGMEKAGIDSLKKKTVAVIGDSTFIHSGITGLINVVYNKGNSTVIVLDNSITGMTGHQPNPATGFTIKNEPTKQVNLVKLGEAIGIEPEHIRVVDPFDLAGLEKVVCEETQTDAPSLIIASRPCALLKSVKYEGTYVINEKCKSCKLCLRLGCPAISLADGKIAIDQTLCNGCGLCKNVCAFGAIVKAGE